MNFNNKFKATALIALALILGACDSLTFPSLSIHDTSNDSSTSQTNSNILSISSSSLSPSTNSSSSILSSSISSSISSSPIRSYVITFINYDDSVLSTTNVDEGQEAIYQGPTPTRPNTNELTYTFTGWDRTLTNITSSFTTKAQFSSSTNTYTVTWQNHDGTTLETDTNVQYGTIPTFNSSNPTKRSTDDYDFTFTGWLPLIGSVTANVTYVAQFTQNLNYIPITNAQELSNIRNNLSGNYRLMNDIDLESVEWQPIGSGSTPFSGTLDGKEFTISNLTITQTQEYVGLFANNSGTIKNLKIGNVQINVTGSISSFIYAGALVAQNTGIINNIETLSGSIFTNPGKVWPYYIGGIIGLHNKNTTLNNLVNRIDITTENSWATGGLIGCAKSIEILNITYSQNHGEVNSLSDFSSGIIGYADYVRGGQETILILDTFNFGIVKGKKYTGGFIGQARPIINIHNSVNYSSITGTSYVSGFIGEGGSYNEINNSSNKGFINGDGGAVGGFLGTGGGTITNSSNEANIVGLKAVGGLIGDGSGQIIDSYNFGNIIASYELTGLVGLGGLVGYSRTINISNSKNYGSIGDFSNNSGGLIGFGITIIIDFSINLGNVNGTTYVGGLIGYASQVLTSSGRYGSVIISNSINQGNVNGSSNVGGLIGSEISLTTNIHQSINSGRVNGSFVVGGLIGRSETSVSTTINNSINKGNVTGRYEVAGLVGYGQRIRITNSFNINDLLCEDRCGGLVGIVDTHLYISNSLFIGNIFAASNSLKLGGITGKIPPINDFSQTYYSGSITSNGLEISGTNFGTKVTDVSTFNLAFFTTTLGWDTEVWDFTGLDIANGVYPSLKNMPVVEE